MSASASRLKKTLVTLAPFALGAALWLTPIPEGLTREAWHLFAIFAAAIFAVIINAFPLLTSALLALSDARADFATLGAVGGAPAIRRRIAGAYGAAIAFTGAVLGAGVGFIPGVAISYPLTTDAWTPALDGRLAVTGEPIADHYLVIPWAIIATLVIGLPILVGLVVAATTRARLPMANRLN
jgi:ABC-type lipoprotein release transport system permease subunit